MSRADHNLITSHQVLSIKKHKTLAVTIMCKPLCEFIVSPYHSNLYESMVPSRDLKKTRKVPGKPPLLGMQKGCSMIYGPYPYLLYLRYHSHLENHASQNTPSRKAFIEVH